MENHRLDNVRGILFDLDGVVHVGSSVVPGAAETLSHLDAKGVPYRFLTNTTTRAPGDLCDMLCEMGLPVTIDEIFTTHQVAAAYLRQRGGPSCYLLVDERVFTLYKGIPVSESHPDCIVIGDIGDRWSYALMNEVFNLVMDGADIIALHKGRFWKTDAGLRLDIGAFISGLEYATGKEAIVVGKPAATFFEMGVEDLGLNKQQVIMVGDDVVTDVRGAQQAGIRGVLVQTGKYREDDVSRSGITPDATLASIADLKDLL